MKIKIEYNKLYSRASEFQFISKDQGVSVGGAIISFVLISNYSILELFQFQFLFDHHSDRIAKLFSRPFCWLLFSDVSLEIIVDFSLFFIASNYLSPLEKITLQNVVYLHFLRVTIYGFEKINKKARSGKVAFFGGKRCYNQNNDDNRTH